jgi:hypothetical protein
MTPSSRSAANSILASGSSRSPSGAGSTPGGHDLVTDRRGHDAARQSHLFIDLVNLASADTDKIRCMYMVGIEAPLRFLKGRRSLVSVLRKHGAVATRFRELHGDKYATVGDYYKSVADHVAVIDLIKILPILAGRNPPA